MQGFVSSNRSSNAITRPRMSTYEPDHVIPLQIEGPDGVRQFDSRRACLLIRGFNVLRLCMAGSMPLA
jgi:hypothetical protein